MVIRSTLAESSSPPSIRPVTRQSTCPFLPPRVTELSSPLPSSAGTAWSQTQSVARTGWRGATEGLASQLYEFYCKLSDSVVVYAAHGSGSPCGANISDRLVTTIGYERRNNEALSFDDETKSVESVLLHAPPELVYYPRMKQENATGPVVLGRLPTCPPMAPKVFEKAVRAADMQLDDNRQMLAFSGGRGFRGVELDVDA